LSDRGYSYWEPAFDLDAQYLNGVTLQVKQMPMVMPDGGGAVRLPMHDGTDVVFNVFRGINASDGYDRKSLSLTLLGHYQEDYWQFKKAKMSAAPVWYAPGYRVNDVFTAVSGKGYILSRRLADGIVPGVSEATHPTKVFLDGVDTPGAITIGGDKQSITANSTGEIEVRYMPVLRVIVTSVPDVVEAHNRLTIDIEMDEIRIGDQG